jgi:hypothetical protein
MTCAPTGSCKRPKQRFVRLTPLELFFHDQSVVPSKLSFHFIEGSLIRVGEAPAILMSPLDLFQLLPDTTTQSARK